MEEITLEAAVRVPGGTKVARSLRRAGRLPAIMYGHGETPQAVSLAAHDVEVALAHGQRTLSVALDGVARSYLIKSVQYDHLGHEPIHVDLARVDMDERVTVNVGIELRGVPKGVSEGGVLDQQIADIEISCRVTDIPETLHPVVTALGLGESLLVKDLELPPGVTALAEPDARVATVRAPAAAVEEEAVSAEAEEAAAQPERIGRVREEEASSEASS